HQLTVPFSAASTWNGLGGGISLGSETVAGAEFTLLPNTLGDYAIFDVTDSIASFASGQSTNYGWMINPSGTDGWRPRSSESSLLDRPILQITYSVPEPSAAWLLLCGLGWLGLGRLLRRNRQAPILQREVL
ncbi:MAG: hypothetical protein JNG90_05975, partial [Planctomycetaceae bacterium]|nr:hypothetical protein [Planctomycetaceae bacterium]